MIRHTINIGSYQYVADLYTIDEDLKDNIQLKQFVIIRNFDLINDLICDKEIYIIEKSLYDEFLKDESNESNDIVFPVTNSNVVSFSNNYSLFNSNISKVNYSTLLNNNLEVANIKCNLIKLYHPHTKVNLKGIISIENYINHIHFYYLCKKYDDFEIHSDTEFRLNNNIYSEYINIWFPSLLELFNNMKDNDNKYNFYYLEELNKVEYIKNTIESNKQEYKPANKIEIYTNNDSNESNVNNQTIDNDKIINDVIFEDYKQYVPFAFFTKKYKIKEVFDDTLNYSYYKKQYIDSKDNIFSDYSITINIFPYIKLDKENENTNASLYLYDDTLTIGNEAFVFDTKFRLASKIGFINTKLSVINKFIYPLSNSFTFNESYKMFNCIDDEEYKDFFKTQYGHYENEVEKINNITSLSDYDKLLLEDYTKQTFDNIDNPLATYKEMLIKGLIEEYEEETNNDIKFIGYKLTIASDIQFKNIILIKNQNINIPLNEIEYDEWELKLDNEFAFDLMHIFNNWEEKPENLIAKVDFIDNYLGITISGNPVVINKEFFKYMINDTIHNQLFNLQDLTLKNKKLEDMEVFSIDNNDVHTLINHYLYNIKLAIQNTFDQIDDEEREHQLLVNIANLGDEFVQEYDSLNTKFNFINHINCNVINENDNTNERVYKESSRIIYKPVFYRVQDLNNIFIESNTNDQNIGINLVNYMSKVESFKLVIDNKEYIEYGRNSIYVIFKININDLTTSSGRYKILTEDNEFISSGNWQLSN